MPRFFIPEEQFHGTEVTITGSDHVHLARVLRARVGDVVEILDNRGGAFNASVVTIERNNTKLKIDYVAIPLPEPEIAITVAQALGKSDKFEQVVQHGTEVGAAGFTPVQADRCVVNLRSAEDRISDRLVRWNQIAKDAAQQCGRSRIPVVNPPIQSSELFRRPVMGDAATLRLLMHPHEDVAPLRSVFQALPERTDGVTIAIGPEGGWSDEEANAAHDSGWIAVNLGSYILRTETAALVAISRILQYFEM